jgi:hypothetical protein
MQHLDGGISVKMLIPDNPEVKSEKAFKYDQGIDALTHGWELTNELISLSATLLASIGLESDVSGVDMIE